MRPDPAPCGHPGPRRACVQVPAHARDSLSAMARVVIERLSEGSMPPADAAPVRVDPPGLEGLRVVFGVGPGPDDVPTHTTFHPVYTVAMPVFSLGGLDADGVYECDAGAILSLLQSRSKMRRWAVRLELDVLQPAASVAAAELYVTGPEDGVALAVVGPGAGGTIVAGGGRCVTVASALAHEPGALAALSGRYELQISDTDPAQGTSGAYRSAPRPVRVELGRFEFEG